MALRATTIDLADAERVELVRLSRKRTVAQGVAFRARIALEGAEGMKNLRIVERLETTRLTVAKWRDRFAADRLDWRLDEPRPGRPREIGDDKVEQIVERTLHSRPRGATHGGRSGCGIETEVPTTLHSVELSDNVGGAQVRVHATHLAAVKATVVSSLYGPVVELEDGATVLVDSSILWNVTLAPLAGVSGGSLVRYSIVRGGWSGTGNLDLDPAFVDRDAGDHRLLATSPGVDAGRPTLSSSGLDAGGVPRLLDGDLDRVPRVDTGAHEYTNLSLALSGSLAPGGSVTLDLGGSTAITTTFLAISPAPTSGLLFSRFGSLRVGEPPSDSYGDTSWPKKSV